MTNPKEKEKTQRRQPGPKTRRSVIPESFQISRISPMRAILDEAENGQVAADNLTATASVPVTVPIIDPISVPAVDPASGPATEPVSVPVADTQPQALISDKDETLSVSTSVPVTVPAVDQSTEALSDTPGVPLSVPVSDLISAPVSNPVAVPVKYKPSVIVSSTTSAPASVTPIIPESAPVSVTPSLSSVSPKTYTSLDATHTGAEQRIYSVMYRETISKKIPHRRFSARELMKLTGIRSLQTINRALNGLKAKKSIVILSRDKAQRFGLIYKVFTPKEIFEARTRAGIDIDLRSKSISTIPTSVTLSDPETVTLSDQVSVTSDVPASDTDFVTLRYDNRNTMYNHDVNTSGPAQTSSVPTVSDEKLGRTRRLFEQVSNGGKWKADRDESAYAQIAHIPFPHILLGLCYSVGRSPEHRMNSLAYAVPSILEHYGQMEYFAESDLAEIGYRTLRKTLLCLQTGKWTVSEWEQ